MRIGIIGASGRVGTRLIEAILASPGLELAAALVSPGSPLIGKPVAGALEYRPAEKTIRSHCDVMIDFSTPAASLAFQDLLGDQRLPVVIGTTGFTVADDAALTAHASARPLLVSANFAHGFEAFKQTALGFASKMPGAEPQVIETYYARKKADPSGTSKMLASEIAAVRSLAMGFAAPETPIAVNREGDTVGINEVRFNLGSAEAAFHFTVHTLAAYAEGAIAAAQWLVTQAPPPGRYSLADSLTR
ncbi:4-hydroxy-tetrahydrodipicolinate reductase [Allorhizobium borbori]|jgi:4-hydroxy-tetrahydrodipicolinate reductase|uniref:4-hydroxy-tetrahydrodipicolinate reductase n=1 Tax=Allorhizobium borbori TaxID=485907 RepID=A0A7W6K191_9HYPH|nr:dihydrodipicolinate reductase C-terminal domain-containing protein [Allorhizobium borbori]MBB4103345.1 4-hydroxy-tetrahydrodipicolinate reductase [Allorhizobium borbori]PZU19870.1 MAG: dihydrodipicolinate reductase [Shinella sp.]